MWTLASKLLCLANAKPAGNTIATQARDGLGLINRVNGEHLLEIISTAESLKTVPYLKAGFEVITEELLRIIVILVDK
jgi:hypothetical protein